MSTGNRTANLNKFYKVDDLTPIEQKVWDLHTQGKMPKEIGEELGVKSTTVSRRLYVIKEKIAVQKF